MKQTNFILWLVGYFYLCVYTNVTAQIVFNKTFQTDTTNRLAACILPALNDTYIFCGGLNAPNNYTSLYVHKINNIGETIFVKPLKESNEYQDIYTLFGGALIRTNDNNYAIVAALETEVNERDFVFIKFNEQGDVIWERNYLTPDSLDAPVGVLQTPDNGFLLYGYTQYFVDADHYEPNHVLLLKTNATGNVIWKKKAGEGIYAHILYAQQTQDGGFVLSGYCYTAATGYDMYAVKTDSLGIVQWEKTYGTNQDDDGCFVLQLQTGNYILFGGIKNDNSDNIYIAELMSNSGNVLWYKQYGVNEYCGVYPLHLTTDNQVVGVQYDYSNSQPTRYYLTKFSTTNGDIIWQSSQIHSNLGDTDDYLRDIEPTADGGFVLAGFNYGSPQSSWVVKTDSLGNTCSFINCDSTIYTGTNTATPALPTKASHIQVYPNPTNNNFTLSYQLPPNIAFGVLELYNTLGQKVLYKQAPQALTKISVSVAHLPAGVYLYRFVTINGVVASGEIIVSR